MPVTPVSAAPCQDCGAVTDPPCAVLWERLMALDHSRRAPWGPLHAVAVAGYLLQHPSDPRAAGADAQRELLRVFVAGGEPALRRSTRQLVAHNAHRNDVRGQEPAVPDRPHGRDVPAVVTIADVAVDGTFPAEGHTERMTDWARAVLAAGVNDG